MLEMDIAYSMKHLVIQKGFLLFFFMVVQVSIAQREIKNFLIPIYSLSYFLIKEVVVKVFPKEKSNTILLIN